MKQMTVDCCWLGFKNVRLVLWYVVESLSRYRLLAGKPAIILALDGYASHLRTLLSVYVQSNFTGPCNQKSSENMK
jgi:hypothetical protein